MRLKNKTAIITGGGSGIGLATARAFCKEGAKVILFGRQKEKLISAANELGESALIIQGDMTKNDDLDQLINNTMNNFNGIDRVVPIGQALNINLVWDGYDLTTKLSREIEIS